MRRAVLVVLLVFLVAQPAGAWNREEDLFAGDGPTTHPVAGRRPAVTPRTASSVPKTPPATLPPHYAPGAAPVSLTFDDGPNTTFTPQVLAVLANYGIQATFFMVGQQVAAAPDLTNSVVAAGHAVGNHTWDHTDLTTLSDKQFASEIERTQAVLGPIVGHRPECVRPPFGRITPHIVQELSARGLRVARWSADTEDWSRPGVDAIVRRALAGAKPGAVILMHDSGPDMSETIAALPQIIVGIQTRGLRFTTMCTGAQTIGRRPSVTPPVTKPSKRPTTTTPRRASH